MREKKTKQEEEGRRWLLKKEGERKTFFIVIYIRSTCKFSRGNSVNRNKCIKKCLHPFTSH